MYVLANNASMPDSLKYTFFTTRRHSRESASKHYREERKRLKPCKQVIFINSDLFVADIFVSMLSLKKAENKQKTIPKHRGPSKSSIPR